MRSEDAVPATRRPPSPHRRHHQKHEQGQCRRQPTQQESVRRRGQGRAGRQEHRETPGAARTASYE
jgi:hypothetical protein